MQGYHAVHVEPTSKALLYQSDAIDSAIDLRAQGDLQGISEHLSPIPRVLSNFFLVPGFPASGLHCSPILYRSSTMSGALMQR